MTREARIGGDPVLVLREPKPIPPPPDHKCAVRHGGTANRKDFKTVIQCSCGKRYKCRQEFTFGGYCWVRRWLPWPPRDRNWP